jgi:hypothetical protein
METGLFSAFSKKVISSIIAIGSMFYSTIDGVTPSMSINDLYFSNEHLIINTVMTNCYTEELEQILASGNKIPINFDVDIYSGNNRLPDTTYSFFHILQFSPIDKNYSVFLSEKNEYIYSLNIDQAKILFTSLIDLEIISSNDLDSQFSYHIKITAWLDKIHLRGMEEDLNLNFYWNSIKPSVTTPIFRKANFQS